MTERRLNVRLAIQGGDRAERELRDVGRAGDESARRMAREAQRANEAYKRLGRQLALVGAAVAAAGAAIGATMVRQSLAAVDASAKLAQSLGTTVESIQVLERAGDLAGIGMGQIEAAMLRLTRRLSLAAAGTGPAADALARLGFEAGQLESIPLDQRVIAIQEAINRFIPEAERAGVASQIFGERAGVIIQRLDQDVLRAAAEDVERFGIAVSEVDADAIETANDSISRAALVWRGVANQLTAAVAPAIARTAEAFADFAARTLPTFRAGLELVSENIGRIAAIAGTFAAFMAARWVRAMALAAASARGVSVAMLVMRGAIVATGVGALIVAAGELVHQFTRLTAGAGGFGEAMTLLGRVASETMGGVGRAFVGAGQFISATAQRIGAAWLSVMNQMRAAFADLISWAASQVEKVPLVGEWFDDWAESSVKLAGEYAKAAASMRRSGETLAETATETLETAFDGVGEAWEQLSRTVRLAEELRDFERDEAARKAAERAAEEARRLAEELDRVTAAADGESGSAGAAAALARVGETAAEQAHAFDRIAESLREYGAQARDWGAGISDSLTNAFGSAENAMRSFVENGKVDFRSLANSIAADMAALAVRQSITGPLSDVLGTAIGSAFGAGPTTSPVPAARPVVAHAGGVVGSGLPTRAAPAALFAGAPRYHGGGVAGLGPREVPAILERGERVLPRGVAPMSVNFNIDAKGSDAGVEGRIEARLRRFVTSPEFAASMKRATRRYGG
jgi:lambda family phage tail tape measure protein